MPAEDPKPKPTPTFKEIMQSIKRIIDPSASARDGTAQEAAPRPRRGFSPGLLLMAVVALVITILAAVKNMK
jgi:hypothetical protein